MNINSSDSIKNAQNSDQKKTGIFNLLKYIPTSLKKSESVQPISSIKSLVKSKNEKYLKESIESFTVVKSENVLSAARERQKHHNEINNTLPNTDKRSSSTAEVRDTYQEISLTPDIHSEKSKESHRKILSCSGTQNVPISDINVNEHNKKLRKFVKPQLKEAVKCFSTLWPEKTYDSRSIFSSRSCFSDSISVKSLHSFVEDSDNYHHYRHTVNIFRLRSLPSSPIKNCETKASSDISQIGPGAVSDAPQLRPIRKTSSVDEARMTTNVKQLESVYKRQQACQRSSVIILPNNFLKSNCHANLIIVLPQKKYKLVNLKSFRDFYLRNCPPMKSKSLDFYHSLKDSSGKEFTHADAESRHTLNFSNKEANDSLTDCICTDKNIIGAVRSWQEGAVWSVSIDDDNNTDVNLKSTSEELSGEDSSLRPYENRKPRLCELASFEGMHFCSPIKYSCSSKTLDDYTVSHDDNNEGTPTDSSVRDTNSPYSTNITYSKKFISDFVLMNMIKHHNERKEADVLCDSKPSRVIHTESPTEVSNEDVHSNATETASFYTSISTSTRKKLPWEEAAASFAPKYHSNKLNSSVTFKKTNKPFSVKIPLTQSRKKFGAKFGIYDDINYKNSPVGSGFIDHIEVITSVCEVPATR
ncbi:unnamed protein product [Heterobilharzia americana]|nr:unnamed protein product [Heterobilharzia americana]